MSGVGPSAWGRVLIAATVRNKYTDRDTKATTVIVDLEFQGDEIADEVHSLRRVVWSRLSPVLWNLRWRSPA
jgi:hypothetical protein